MKKKMCFCSRVDKMLYPDFLFLYFSIFIATSPSYLVITICSLSHLKTLLASVLERKKIADLSKINNSAINTLLALHLLSPQKNCIKKIFTSEHTVYYCVFVTFNKILKYFYDCIIHKTKIF